MFERNIISEDILVAGYFHLEFKVHLKNLP